MSSLFGRKVVAYKLNNSGGGVIKGDVLVPDTSADNAFTTTTSAAVVTGVWIADETIAAAATGRVVLSGHVTLVNVSASVTRGHTGTTHTVAKQAVSTGATTRTAGTFCKFTTGGTTPEADIWPVDLLGTSLTNPMTTSGDIIYGGASGVPTRLAGGTSAYVLTSNGATSAPSWQAAPGGGTSLNPGTSFPGSPATNDLCFRTDRAKLYYYDGTRWLTVQEYSSGMSPLDTVVPIASSGNTVYSVLDEAENGMYVSRVRAWTLVTPTNTGSAYWSVQVRSKTATGTTHNLGSTFDTSADTAGNRVVHSVTIGSVVTSGDTNIEWVCTKTGSPSGLYLVGQVFYRLIG